jgi:hypothetical protein
MTPQLPSIGALLHDNAVPLFVQTIDSMNLEVLQQPPYTVHLSGPPKEALRGRKISSADDVKDIVQD